MRLRYVTLLSLAANLAVGWAVLRDHPRGLERSAPPSTRWGVPTPTAPELATVKPGTPPSPEIESFHWSQLEPDDLTRFAGHLRRIGCPSDTRRRLVLSAVDELYRAKVLERIRPYRGRFWDLMARLALDEDSLKAEVDEFIERLETLETERRELVEALLGPNRGEPPREPYQFSKHQRSLVDFLSEDRQAAFAQVQRDHSLRVRQESSEGHLTPGRRRELDQERSTALQALMTPEEWMEYRLRNSRHAQLRELMGVNWSEEELRSVVALRLQADDARAAQTAAQSAPSQEDYRQRMMERYGLSPTPSGDDATGLQLKEQVRALLGDERYVQYERAQDGRYVETRRITDRLGLDPELAASIYDIQRQAAEQALKWPELSDADRDAWLTTLREEARRAIGEVLPPGSAADYQELSADWWDGLGR
jgi:hypothetical protein